jgi:hypothetical protein
MESTKLIEGSKEVAKIEVDSTLQVPSRIEGKREIAPFMRQFNKREEYLMTTTTDQG